MCIAVRLLVGVFRRVYLLFQGSCQRFLSWVLSTAAANGVDIFVLRSTWGLTVNAAHLPELPQSGLGRKETLTLPLFPGIILKGLIKMSIPRPPQGI